MKKQAKSSKYPLKHLTARVPWHDSGWIGKVCDHPKANTACQKLENIIANKVSEEEEKVAGKFLNEIDEKQWPPCIRERSTFMAPFEHYKTVNHPYNKSSKETHGHFRDTPLRIPPYSVLALPFNWMIKEFATENKERFDFNFNNENEPELKFDSPWMQGEENQENSQNAFFEHLYEDESLVFLYAKEVPLIETHKRILIGVGRVKHKGQNTRYLTEKKGQMTCLIWERPIQHSIRPDFKDGFILPLKEIFERGEKDGEFNVEDFVIQVPEHLTEQFSFGSEHLSTDGSLEILKILETNLRKIQPLFKGPWEECISWVNAEASRLKKKRGFYPGLGSALTAFGLKNGEFIAWQIHNVSKNFEKEWQILEDVFKDPSKYLDEDLAKTITKNHQKMWKSLNLEEKNVLQLISLFDVSPEQATFIYQSCEEEEFIFTPKEIIENPYIIYERTRLIAESIALETIDMGLSQTRKDVSEKLSLDSAEDPRRIRALSIQVLEDATKEGHTLLPRKIFLDKIKSYPITNPPTITNPAMRLAEDIFRNEINLFSVEGIHYYQLSRLGLFTQLISRTINDLLSNSRFTSSIDWSSKIEEELGAINSQDDSREKDARIEKAAALKELYESRLSVLIGPAGTGKTTMLKILCDHPTIKEGGVLLLAPTGKARVKLQTKSGSETRTLAQFLGQCDRFIHDTQRYVASSTPPVQVPRTVIVDECSMLTEEMLGALLQGIKGFHRLILVGDHDQLPPIGPGRPFLDIIRRIAPENLSFPRVGQGFCELTIPRRQKDEQETDDVKLASWFRSAPPEIDADEIFSLSQHQYNSKRLRLVRWDDSSQIPNLIEKLLNEEMKIENEKDFNISIGSEETGSFFNRDAGKKAEEWQILAPNRVSLHGTTELNKIIHEKFRNKNIELAYKFKRTPAPLGLEKIVYGDKVINTQNHKRGKKYPTDKYPDVWPLEGSLQYVANGEVGIVVGRFKKEKWSNSYPQETYVNFSSQPGFTYTYRSKDFSDENLPILELAYALTVHKAQGSEFRIVFLILPNPCRLLSKEMLYTSLTRQQDKLIILHQGSFQEILKLSSPLKSDAASRFTNLFKVPVPRDIKGKYMDENLIHLASDGTALRSKSELFIYERLIEKNVMVQYERPLNLGSISVIPDFTIDSPANDKLIIWEHAGMLDNPVYRKRWEKKLNAYRKNGILPLSEGGGPAGILIFTEDSPNKGLNAREIDNIISIIQTRKYNEA